MSYPVMEDDRLLGVAAVDLGLSKIRQYVEDLGNKNSASIGLFTMKGSVIYEKNITDTNKIYNFSSLLKMIGTKNMEADGS